MKKTLTVILLVCLLAMIPAAVMAEGSGTKGTEENNSAVLTESIQFDIQFRYMPSITPLKGTNLITMESKTDNSLGLFTTEGQELIPYGLSHVNKMKYGFLSVSKDLSNLNSKAIYKEDGTQISDYKYEAFASRDDRWVAGMVLSKASGKEKDTTINKVDYLIEQYDIYFVSEKGSTLVASLDRAHYKTWKQHGDYIAIQNREDGTITAYDQKGRPITIELTNVKDAFFQVTNYQIINRINNEVIADGYVEVTEADAPNRMLLIASIIDMDGVIKQAILTADGKQLMPAEYAVVTMDDPYVVVANEEGLCGLYSLAEERLVVPCEFSNIITFANSIDQYVNNGYVCVEKDGKYGFVDARTGSITCPLIYNSRIAKVYGSSLVFEGENGFVLIAADGTRTALDEYEEIPAAHGDGYLLVAKKNGYYGLIDWHGNEKLPFIHNNIITLTDDSKAMIRTSTGLELDVITAR